MGFLRRASCSRMPKAVGRSCVLDACCLDLQRPFLALTANMVIRWGESGIDQTHSTPTPRCVSSASTTPAARPCHPTPVSHSPFLDQGPALIGVLSTHRSGQAPPATRRPTAHGRRKNDERPNLASPCRPTVPLLRTPTSPLQVFDRLLHRSPNARLWNLHSSTACEACPSEDRRAHGDLLPPPGDVDVVRCDLSEPARVPCCLRRRCAIESRWFSGIYRSLGTVSAQGRPGDSLRCRGTLH